MKCIQIDMTIINITDVISYLMNKILNYFFFHLNNAKDILQILLFLAILIL